MNFCVTAEELRAALADLEVAERNGFKHSLAVFEIGGVGPMLKDVRAVYKRGDIWTMAHPTDGNKDWGRGGAYRSYRYSRGQLRPLGKTGE